MLMNENRIAFIRRETQEPPKTRRFMIVFKFIAKIMIHHQAAFSPKSPDGSCPRQNPPSSPSAPPPTSRNAPDANGSTFHPPNPCWSPDRIVCNAEGPSATSERETPAAASREDPSIPSPHGSQDTDKQEHFCCVQSRLGQNKPPPTPGLSESACRQTPCKSAANPSHSPPSEPLF